MVEAPARDTPDLSLKSGGLVESGEGGEIRKVLAGETLYTSAKTFEELGLSAQLLQGLYVEMKFERPSKIQAETLPLILSPPHRSLIAQAHNGSGKTTCFTLAMLSRVDVGLQAPQALCVCPTRELVIQNAGVLERIGKFSGISITSTAAADYGASRRSRIADQIVVGTHGKLRDWMSKRVLAPKDMKILVFDEADEMLKQDGFADDSVRMIRLLQQANPNLQILLFSATFNERVKAFAQKVVKDANQVGWVGGWVGWGCFCRAHHMACQGTDAQTMDSCPAASGPSTGVCAQGGPQPGRHQAIPSGQLGLRKGEIGQCVWETAPFDDCAHTLSSAHLSMFPSENPPPLLHPSSVLPDHGRQGQGPAGHDLPPVRAPGSNHHLCPDQGDRPARAPAGAPSGAG